MFAEFLELSPLMDQTFASRRIDTDAVIKTAACVAHPPSHYVEVRSRRRGRGVRVFFWFHGAFNAGLKFSLIWTHTIHCKKRDDRQLIQIR
jgi:hypothetical protein